MRGRLALAVALADAVPAAAKTGIDGASAPGSRSAGLSPIHNRPAEDASADPNNRLRRNRTQQACSFVADRSRSAKVEAA